jgi:hypothetical protein
MDVNDRPHKLTRAEVIERHPHLENNGRAQQFVVPALPQAHPITPAEASVIEGGLNLARGILGIPTTHHARSDDNAITIAQGNLINAVPIVAALALITVGLTLLAWRLIGGGAGWYVLGWLVLWGACVLVAIVINNRQGQYHSAAGVGHHEIDARENVATTAVIEHNKSLRYKWTIEYVERTGKEPPRIEID